MLYSLQRIPLQHKILERIAPRVLNTPQISAQTTIKSVLKAPLPSWEGVREATGIYMEGDGIYIESRISG